MFRLNPVYDIIFWRSCRYLGSVKLRFVCENRTVDLWVFLGYFTYRPSCSVVLGMLYWVHCRDSCKSLFIRRFNNVSMKNICWIRIETTDVSVVWHCDFIFLWLLLHSNKKYQVVYRDDDIILCAFVEMYLFVDIFRWHQFLTSWVQLHDVVD